MLFVLVLRDYAKPGCLDKAQPCFLRPWHLPWHPQCGLKGVVETDARRDSNMQKKVFKCHVLTLTLNH